MLIVNFAPWSMDPGTKSVLGESMDNMAIWVVKFSREG